jgi:opacity protein-like surface antigen
VGGGGEVALSEHLIATAEVLYFDLGSSQATASAPAFATATVDVDQKVAGTLLRAGIAYKF